MRDTRITLLKVTDPSPHTGSENMEPNLSARSSSRSWNVGDAESIPKRSDSLGVPTHFKSFPDGSMIETVRDPQRRDGFRLAVYKDGKTQIADQFQYDGDLFVPGEILSNLAPHLRLAAGISPCGTPRGLLAELVATFRDFVDLPDAAFQILGAFVLCSWFADRLRVAPYLGLVGPLASGKTTIMRLLEALCRRAFLVGDLTPASLYKLPTLLGLPTLFIDENDLGNSLMSGAIQRLLRTGNTPGTIVMRNDRGFDPYCVKVLASREPPSDAALASRSVVIGTWPSNRRLAPLDEAAIERIAIEFQPKLLMFRLQNFHTLRVSDSFFSRIDDMSPRTRDLAHALGVPLLGDSELEAGLVEVLQRQDEDSRVLQSLEPEWLVVQALFALCHETSPWGTRLPRKLAAVLVGGIAEKINLRMSELGEDLRLSAKKTGLVLRELGVRTKVLGNLGRGIELTPALRETVHKISRNFGVDRRSLINPVGGEPAYGGAPCTQCEKFGLTGGLKYVGAPERAPVGPIRTRPGLFEGESSTASTESL